MTRRLWLASLVALPACTRKVSSTGPLLNINEKTFREMVRAYHGNVLLVDFWATWCVPCREEMPKLVTLANSYRSKGFRLVTISCDEPEQRTQAQAFVQKQAAPDPHYIRHVQDDDKFINSIDPKWSGALPALFLFDRNGNAITSFVGETDMGQLQAAIDKQLSA